MRRITVNDRDYAVGLQWHLANVKQTSTALRLLSQKEFPDCDMVAFRQRQWAFGASKDQVRDWLGVRALGSAVRIPAASFLGLFCLEDAEGEFWWVFAMSQSLVVGMGDQVFKTRQEADNWINSLRDLLNYEFTDTVVCQTVEESLNWLSPITLSGFSLFMFSSRHNGCLISLKAVPSLQRDRYIALGSVLLLILVLYGLKLFWDYRSAKQTVMNTISAKLNIEKHRQNVADHPEMYFPRAWMEAPEVGNNAKTVISAMMALPLSVNGWFLDGASFDGKELDVTWAFRPGADYTHLPLNAHIETPQKLISSYSLPARPPRSASLALLSRDECTRRLYQCTQLLSGKLELTFQLAEKRIVDGVEILCPWLKGKWEQSSLPTAVVLDSSFPLGFTQMPGLILSGIIFKDGIWTFKGEIYATYSIKN